MRKTALLQKPHLFGSFRCIGRSMAEFFLPDFTCPRNFTIGQSDLDFSQRARIDAMALQFGQDTIVAEAHGATMHERLGKPGLR